MAKISKYRGASLAGDKIMEVGEYLMSPNGRFCAQLQSNGLFGVYWNPIDRWNSYPAPEFDASNAVALWTSETSGNQDQYFIAMQTDGNVCVYHGTDFQHNRGLLWTIDRKTGGGTYALNMQNDGCLRVTRDGKDGWGTKTEVIELGISTIISAAKDGETILALSSNPPSGAQSGLSVTDLPRGARQDWPATPDQLWFRLHWLEDRGQPKKDLVAAVMVNQATGLGLTGLTDGGTGLGVEITPWSLWTFGADENTAGYRAIRPYANENQNLNVKGNAPYASGTSVVLWRWTGPDDNLIWRFFGNYPPPPIPPSA